MEKHVTSLVRKARSWAAERARWVQYPPERRIAARRPQIHWATRTLLLLFTLWLAIVGGVVVAGMIWVGSVFVWAAIKYG